MCMYVILDHFRCSANRQLKANEHSQLWKGVLIMEGGWIKKMSRMYHFMLQVIMGPSKCANEILSKKRLILEFKFVEKTRGKMEDIKCVP